MSEGNGSESNGGQPAAPSRPGAPVPLTLSIVAGALGVALLLLGAVTGNDALPVAAVVAGSLSLGAALYWRSMLISAWGAQKRGRPPES